MPMFHFYKSWKCQKTRRCLTFSGGIDMSESQRKPVFRGYRNVTWNRLLKCVGEMLALRYFGQNYHHFSPEM